MVLLSLPYHSFRKKDNSLKKISEMNLMLFLVDLIALGLAAPSPSRPSVGCLYFRKKQFFVA